MVKSWKKESEEKFTLYTNGQNSVHVLFPKKRFDQTAIIEFQAQTFKFQKVGFANSGAQIINDKNQIIINLKLKNWYSDIYAVEMGDKEFQIKTKNSPLVKFELSESEIPLLIYGLVNHENKPVLKIDSYNSDISPLLDALLFILFYPILISNFSDDLLLLLLMG